MQPWRAIEFFAGIGGFACAATQFDLRETGHGDSSNAPDVVQAVDMVQAVDIVQAINIVQAIDIDRHAHSVYQLNWTAPYHIAEIASLDHRQLESLRANMWWLSPPCQPYSRRGNYRDIDDPRAAGLLRVIDLIEPLLPEVILLENVVGFERSISFQRLNDQLRKFDYVVASLTLCPTQMGWPNRRPRFYLLARRGGEPISWRPLPQYDRTVSELIADHAPAADAMASSSLQVDPAIVAMFGEALDRVDLLENQRCVTACFGSSYGKSLQHAGSYLRTSDGYRRFAPQEVAALLGYPHSFRLPRDMPQRTAWKLLGNSLSIPAVRYVLSHIQTGSLLGRRC